MKPARNIYREKTLNAMIFFAKNTNSKKIGKTKMAKLLFALDFECFRQTGRFVTGLDYYAFPYGPFPKELLGSMDEKHFPSDFSRYLSLIFGGETKDEGGFLFHVRPKISPNLSLFSPREQKIMSELAEIWRDCPAKMISQWSHSKGEPWQIVWEKEGRQFDLISYLYAIDNNSPITQEEAAQMLIEEKETAAAFPMA